MEKNPTLFRLLFGEQAETARRYAAAELVEWAELFDGWLETRRSIGPKVEQQALRTWGRFLGQIRKPPGEIEEADVAAFGKQLEQEGRSALQQQRAMIELATFYQYASQRLPAERAVDPTARLERKRPALLSEVYYLLEEQAAALLEATKANETPVGRRNYAMFLAGVSSALRPAEIQRLRWGELALETESGTGWARPGGPGLARRKGKFSGTERAEPAGRRVRLEREVVEAILDWLGASGRLAGMAGEDFVFTARRFAWSGPPLNQAEAWKAEAPVDTATLNYFIKETAEAAGLVEGQVTWYTLRNTALLRRATAGDPLSEIAEQFGFNQVHNAQARVRLLRKIARPVEWRPAAAAAKNFYAAALPAEDLERLERLAPQGLEGELNALRVVMFHNLRHALAAQDPKGLLRLLEAYSSAVARMAASLRVERRLEEKQGGEELDWSEVAQAILQEHGWEEAGK